MFSTVTLERTNIVAAPEFREQILQDIPIATQGCQAKGLFKVLLQVPLDPVVVEQCVVHVDEEDDGVIG
jgi:hypothetical protein